MALQRPSRCAMSTSESIDSFSMCRSCFDVSEKIVYDYHTFFAHACCVLRACACTPVQVRLQHALHQGAGHG
jgi:hypothetical protein